MRSSSKQGSSFYVYSNAFYRRVVQGAEEQFVVVTPPAVAVPFQVHVMTNVAVR